MVLAALCEHYLPSHRGLVRDHQSLAVANDRRLWQQHHYENSERSVFKNSNGSSNNGDYYTRNSILDLSKNDNDNEQNLNNSMLLYNHKPSTKPKRNRCKASKFLASCAADFDVLTDWLFYAHCRNANMESFEATGIYQIPPWMVGMVLASCLIGTTLWLVLATDGAIAIPILRKFGYDKLSLGHILLMCVVFEDLPQIVLTFFIEDYFEEDQEFNNYAVVNVVASLYDILIKLAEAYDQRADIVETGHWCKESIPAHTGKIVCIVPIPEDSDENEDGNLLNGNLVKNSMSQSIGGPINSSMYGSSRVLQDTEANSNPSSLFRNKLHVSIPENTSRRRTLLQEAQEMVADTKLPPMQFLSSSKDGNVKLWNTAVSQISDDGVEGRRPCEAFVGHKKRVSCISLVRSVRSEDYSRRRIFEPAEGEVELEPLDSSHRSSSKPTYYFLTGSYDGTCKLWETSKPRCLKTYTTTPSGNDSKSTNLEITSIAYIDSCTGDERQPEAQLAPYVSSSSSSSPSPLTDTGTRSEYFVSGYKSGKVRLWDMWSGSCLRIFMERNPPSKRFFRAYRRNKSRIYSLCSMEDSRHFAVGLGNGTIKMWDVGLEDSEAPRIAPTIVETDESDADSNCESDYEMGKTSTSTDTDITGSQITATPARVFMGHSSSVWSIKCVSPGSVLLSGSEDMTARLWSVSTGTCLKTFLGHTGPICDVAIVDQVTFLTASRDRTIRAWDALSGETFRTYENYSAAVTSVATGDQSGCFLSGDENGNIGLWIFSAVHDEHHRANLLGLDDQDVMLCGGCEGDGDEELITEDYTRMT